MRGRIRFILGSVLAIAGAYVMLYPFLSVWQVAGQALGELPQIADVESSSTSHEFGALYDGEFVLATRSYSGTTPERVQEALIRRGFEAARVNGSPWYIKQCCGEYDAVWVKVSETSEDGTVLASAAAADADIQVAVVFLVLFGLVLFVPGVIIGLSRPTRRTDSKMVDSATST